MTSEAIKESRHQRREAKKAREAQMLHTLLTNPVIEILLGFGVIEFMQTIEIGKTSWRFSTDITDFGVHSPETRYLMPSTAGSVAEAGILFCVAAQQLAPLAPYLASGITDFGKAGTSILGAGKAILKLGGQ